MLRRCVLLALASALTAGAAPAEDALIIRDGTRRKGAVSGCREDACTLDGAKVARGLIAWVGLRQDDAAPPPARDPLKDEVHLLDGRVVAGEFGGLSLGAVAIGDASFERDEVAWIRFAGPEPAGSPRPSPREPNYRFSPSPPAASPPVSSPPPTRPPSMAPPSPSTGGSPQPSPGSGGRGALWTGTLRAREVYPGPGLTGERNSLFSLRLREVRIYPLLIQLSGKWQDVGRNIGLENEGSTVTTREAHTSGSRRCSGQGTVTFAGGSEGPAGHLYLKTRDVDVTPVLRFDVPRAGGRYAFATYDPGSHSFLMTCREEGRSSTAEGYYPVIPVSHLDPQEPRQGFVDPEARGLVQGRMQGSYSASTAGTELTVTWMLCREGDACPPLPERGGPEPASSPSPDPCGDLAQARSLVDVLWEQRQSRLPALEQAWRELEVAHQEMLFNRDAWQTAVSACALQDIVTVLVTRAGGDYTKALALIKKIATGDLSYLIQSKELKAALQLVKAAFTVAGANNPANMRGRISGCAALTDDLRGGALAFVDNYAEVGRLMPVVQEHLNYINDKDEAYWNEWNRYYTQCLTYAQCKGLPASTCPAPPPTPSGPMPRE